METGTPVPLDLEAEVIRSTPFEYQTTAETAQMLVNYTVSVADSLNRPLPA
jgi:hypothetical protein